MRSGEPVYEIKKEIGVLSKESNGWTKELNIVAWNGGAEKFDIRSWDPDHERMSRGITLTSDEAKMLYVTLDEYFENKGVL